MRARVLAGYPLLCLLVGILGSGCAGRTVAPGSSLVRTQAELAQGRGQVARRAEELAAAIRRSGLSHSPTVLGSYRACRAGKNLIAYNEAITVLADMPATVPGMSRDIVGMLRSESWQLVRVDFAKVHLALADTDHPLYDITQRGMKGAANILPYRRDRAAAIIFMRSPCVRGGSLAARVEQDGHL